MSNPYVNLAKKTIDSFIRTENLPDDLLSDLPAELTEKKAACFVSIKEKGDLRGCIGTLEPYRENLAYEIIGNAISASTRDPRFYPIRPEELDDLEISVDVLSPAYPVEDISTHDVKKHGIIVYDDTRRGVLLPDLEGVDTTEDQIRIAAEKGGFYPGEDYKLLEFTVLRYMDE